MQPEEIQYDILDEGIHDPYCFKSIFVVGCPGSGKTTIERNLGLEARGLKSLNADNTMLRLKNIRPSMDNKDYPHAGEATEKRFNVWRRDYLGLILNTTGRNLNTIQRLNENLKASYYNTFMLYVDVDESIARERIQSRYVNSQHPEDKNRVVDMDYFETAYKSVKNNLKSFESMFGQNFALVKNDDFNLLAPDFEMARKKLNKFLMTPASPEAQAILKGVSSNQYNGLGRNYSRI
jgi:predicted ABC-type ATPase